MRAVRPRLLGLSLAASLLGCSVSSANLSKADLTVNECEDDAGCSGGRCVDKVCRGTDGALTSLLVSVTTATTSPDVASLTYYQSFPTAMHPLEPDGGGLNIELPQPVVVTGFVYVDTPDCDPFFSLPLVGSTPPADSIPPEVTFTPSQRTLGVPGETYTAELRSYYEYRANLPPANYDVYIRPKYAPIPSPTDGSACPVPPRLLLNQEVSSSVNFRLPPASKLNVGITWPIRRDELGQILPDPPLTGWTLDMIEARSGRPLSTPTLIGEPEATGQTTATYSATIDYAPMYAWEKGELKPTDVGKELIRLTPPADQTAPVLLAELSAAQAGGTSGSPAQVLLAKQLPPPVTVQFQTVLAGDEDTFVDAAVTLTAMQIEGVVGLSTSFSRTVQVASGATAEIALLPGRYRVVGSPKGGCDRDGCLGTTISEWIVAAQPGFQAGRVVQFSHADQLSGQAFVANLDKPAAGAVVRAIASPLTFETNVLNQGDAGGAVLPRASAGLVAPDGGFAFEADHGTFDLRIEPDVNTGFGWLVMPQVTVPAPAEAFGHLVVPLPVVYRGVVSLGSSETATLLPGALIRAYVYMKNGELLTKASEGAVAIQVAETHADGAGVFNLLVPARLGSD